MAVGFFFTVQERTPFNEFSACVIFSTQKISKDLREETNLQHNAHSSLQVSLQELIVYACMGG